MRWAKTATSELPLFLAITETEAIRLNDVLNLVFDETHPFHSRRLVVAIKAWDIMYNQEKISSVKGTNDQIKILAKELFENDGCKPPEDRGLESIAYVARKSK